MKNKIKLTEVRRLESSKEEMGFIKGGKIFGCDGSISPCDYTCNGYENDGHVQVSPGASGNNHPVLSVAAGTGIEVGKAFWNAF